MPPWAVETFVLAELLKHVAFSKQRLSLWHYRTQTNIEVDFILGNRLGQITGIEVKASATVDGKDFKGLRHLQETEQGIFQCGIVLYAGREVVPFGDRLWAVPMSIWWAEGALGLSKSRRGEWKEPPTRFVAPSAAVIKLPESG